MGYDIIGNIHGHATELEALLVLARVDDEAPFMG